MTAHGPSAVRRSQLPESTPTLTDATIGYQAVHYCLFGRSMIAIPLPFTQIEARAENASCRPSGDQTG